MVEFMVRYLSFTVFSGYTGRQLCRLLVSSCCSSTLLRSRSSSLLMCKLVSCSSSKIRRGDLQDEISLSDQKYQPQTTHDSHIGPSKSRTKGISLSRQSSIRSSSGNPREGSGRREEVRLYISLSLSVSEIRSMEHMEVKRKKRERRKRRLGEGELTHSTFPDGRRMFSG